MSSTSRHWAPKSVDSSLSTALAVSSNQPMTASLHRQLLADKVRRLFKEAGLQGAQAAMEMSAEHLPELYSLSQQASPQDLPDLFLYSDTLQAALNLIDWKSEPSDPSHSPLLAMQLREQTLASLLEAL